MNMMKRLRRHRLYTAARIHYQIMKKRKKIKRMRALGYGTSDQEVSKLLDLLQLFAEHIRPEMYHTGYDEDGGGDEDSDGDSIFEYMERCGSEAFIQDAAMNWS